MVEITQADREAAASVAVLVEMRELILAGKADHHAEPWARHREAGRATPAPMSDDALVEAAHRVLMNWRLSTMVEAEDHEVFYPLLDAVSTPGGTIETGERELGEIAFAVLSAVRPAIEAAAREDERAKVVAWLRAHEASGLYGEPFDEAADAIERGKHRENGDG